MSQSSQQGQSDDEGLKLAVIFFILGLILLAILAAFTNELNAFIGAVSWLHVLPFAFAAEHIPQLLEIPFVGTWLFYPALKIEEFLSSGGYAYMGHTENGISQRDLVLTAAGRAACVIYGPLYLLILLSGGRFRPDRIYRQRHNLETMINMQAQMWPTTRIIRRVNPLNQEDIDIRSIAKETGSKMEGLPPSAGRLLPRKMADSPIPAWGRALAPEEWLVVKGLAFDLEKYRELVALEDVQEVAFEFREQWEHLKIESISEAFADQLRDGWVGPHNLRPILKALFAVMALFYGYEVKKGNDLLVDLGVLAEKSKGKPGHMDKILMSESGFMARIEAIIAGEMGRNLAKIGDGHAWVETAFPTFLAIARDSRGVLASASFIWLKSEDRLMWYILNNIGSEAIMVEAAGALAHHRAEIQIGKAIVRPAVYQASRSLLEDYLDMTSARVKKRQEKEERQRKPGAQIDMMIEAHVARDAPRAAGEGLDDDEVEV